MFSVRVHFGFMEGFGLRLYEVDVVIFRVSLGLGLSLASVL